MTFILFSHSYGRHTSTTHFVVIRRLKPSLIVRITWMLVYVVKSHPDISIYSLPVWRVQTCVFGRPVDCAWLAVEIPELQSVFLMNHAQPVVFIYINLITRLFLKHLLLLYHWTLSQRHFALPHLILCPMLALMAFCRWFLVIVKLGKIRIESVFERSSSRWIETHFPLFLSFDGLVLIG
jgi:hypothetical protein